jgi:acid phosphatase (class A)
MRKLAILSVVLLSACANLGAHQAATPAAPATTQAASAPAFYVDPSSIDLTLLLPPPPAPGSAAQKADVDTVLAAQKARSKMLADEVTADAKSTIYRFADVLGPNFSEDKLPVTTAFFKKVQKNTSAFADVSKECYARQRPFVADARIKPPNDLGTTVKNDPAREAAARAKLPADAANRCAASEGSPEYSYSYPSGHSTFGAMTAILLSDMVPEKRAELFRRGWYYGQERVIAGVHFPTDLEAGRIQASIIAAQLMQSPDFQKDFAAARTELRGVLGLAN